MSKSAGGNNKAGRNTAYCLRYKNSNQRFTNKTKKVARHLKRFPGDKQAKKWLAA